MNKRKMLGKAKSSKVLGIDVGVLLQSCLQKKGSIGTLSLSEFNMFWHTVGSTKEANAFLERMLGSLVMLLDKPDAMEVSLSTLINTIQFIALNLPVNVPASVQCTKTLKQWEADAAKGRQHPLANEVVRCLSMLDGQQDELAHHAAKQSVMLHSIDEYRRMTDSVHFPTFTDQDIRSGEAVFYWPYLRRRLAEDPGMAVGLIDRMIAQSRAYVQMVKANPKLAQTSLMATLHIVRELLAVGPVVEDAAAAADGGALGRALKTLSTFFLWPLPYGLMARDLLGAVTEERHSPGASMRRLFAAEQQTAQVAGHDDELGQAARPAFYFVDSGSAWVRTFVHTLALQSYDEAKGGIGSTYQGELSATTALMLAASALGVRTGGPGEALAADMRRVGAEQALALWRDVQAALEETEEEAAAGEPAAREARLDALRGSVPALVGESSSPCMPAPGRAERKAGRGFPTPRLPPVAHIMLESADEKYQFLDRATIKLMCAGHVPFPLTPISQQLEDLLETYKCQASAPVNVRLVLAAGNSLMHSFVCAYAGLLQSKPEGIKGVNLQIFLVPLERNHVASFLARFDSYYNRHVYVPFRSPIFAVPWIDNDGPNRDALFNGEAPVSEDPTPIGVFYREMVSIYLREARSTYRMQLWKLKGWLRGSPVAAAAAAAADGGAAGEADDDESHDQSIPFLQRFEMGLVADARSFQREKGMPADTPFQSLVKDRAFQFSPPEVRVTFTRVDMHGHALPALTDEGVTYNSVLLSNVPRRGDPCFPPSPAKPWLEMHARPTDSSRNRGKVRKNALVNDPKQHVSRLVIECADPERDFLVRIDGNNFGPFSRVEISPMTNPQTGEAQVFPVQTFFPVDV